MFGETWICSYTSSKGCNDKLKNTCADTHIIILLTKLIYTVRNNSHRTNSHFHHSIHDVKWLCLPVFLDFNAIFARGEISHNRTYIVKQIGITWYAYEYGAVVTISESQKYAQVKCTREMFSILFRTIKPNDKMKWARLKKKTSGALINFHSFLLSDLHIKWIFEKDLFLAYQKNRYCYVCPSLMFKGANVVTSREKTLCGKMIASVRLFMHFPLECQNGSNYVQVQDRNIFNTIVIII